ncbi:trypsin-like peptidase domain-containing protein [Streptomyces sp. NPDC050704]|uniref:VMAP-C domain-containing protein n=1 Tax=Streptomyces sp. NPDC050704 TaxID=3157219 RepID=UPI00344AE39B
MTDGHLQGASSDLDTAHRALRELVMAATVRIHRAGAGYALDEPGTFLGSGFFIAPNWVLTCAHVARSEEGGEVTVVYETGPGRGTSAVPGEVTATLPDHVEPSSRGGNWPAPDLALVQLREPVDHDCVYVTERPAAYYGEGRVFYAGWTVMGGQLQFLDGILSVQGTLGGWSAGVQMRLGQDTLPPGVSGGPVVDPVRGEVIGVLKSRADRGTGGTSTGVEQLRALPVPPAAVSAEHDDPYQAVFHAHDRYHRDRQRHPDSDRSTWADVQGQLGARPGRTLGPDERTQLLGRLADLPPPVSTRALLDLLESLLGSRAAIPLPAPRGWRDGLGALYESSRRDGALELVLDYTMRVMSAERPYTTPGTQRAEQALWEWARQAAEGLGIRYRRALAHQRIERLRLHQPPRVPQPPPGPEHNNDVARRRDAVDVVPAPHPEVPAPRPETDQPLAVSPGVSLPAVTRPGADAPGTVMPGTSPTTAVPGVASRPSGPPVGQEHAVAHGAERAPRLSALLEIVQRGWEPDRCDWRISVARPTGEVVRLHEAERASLGALPGDLAAPLAEAFRRCDEPGRPAVLQVGLPHPLLGLAVDAWRLRPGDAPLGVYRPVVVRCADRDQLPDGDEPGPFGKEQLSAEEERVEREARWRWIHAHGAQTEILDCEDGLHLPVPPAEALRRLPHSAVPVLCRFGDQRFEDDVLALARIVHGGFGVALWRRRRGRSEAVCGEFHRGADDTVAGADSAERLPELVHALRAGLCAGRPETYWADGIALFYDDPRRPLPGTGDLLEAP